MLSIIASSVAGHLRGHITRHRLLRTGFVRIGFGVLEHCNTYLLPLPDKTARQACEARRLLPASATVRAADVSHTRRVASRERVIVEG